jgi:hypothetical protein
MTPTPTPTPAPRLTSIAVYHYSNLLTPVLTHATSTPGTTVMYGNVDKPELRFGDTTQILVPKAWDIIQVRCDPDNVVVVVRDAVR